MSIERGALEACPDVNPARVVLRVECRCGAYREFAADNPRDYALRVQESNTPGEPLIIVFFAGNPLAAGMKVSQEGHPIPDLSHPRRHPAR